MRNLGILLKTNLKTVFGISKLKHEKPLKLIGYSLLAVYVVYSLFVTFGFYSELTADTLEKYKQRFKDNNYFIAFSSSKNYYFNNIKETNPFQQKYQLSENKEH